MRNTLCSVIAEAIALNAASSENASWRNGPAVYTHWESIVKKMPVKPFIRSAAMKNAIIPRPDHNRYARALPSSSRYVAAKRVHVRTESAMATKNTNVSAYRTRGHLNAANTPHRTSVTKKTDRQTRKRLNSSAPTCALSLGLLTS